MSWYLTIKSLHVASVAISATLFVLRGVWMIQNSDRLSQRWVRVTPHMVDTVLLVSAIILTIQIQQYPFIQPWLTAKVIALLVYIGLGMVALHHGRSRQVRVVSWVAALIVLVYIIAVALTRSVLPGV
ncbi:MAG: SirB2 family protein [Gammaproteobacteria bacterium]|jgi:uncharacterized membrane protein SirB2